MIRPIVEICIVAYFGMNICDQVCENQPYQRTKIDPFSGLFYYNSCSSYANVNRTQFLSLVQNLIENLLKLIPLLELEIFMKM